MDMYRFVLGIVLGLYIGFPRLNQLRFMEAVTIDTDTTVYTLYGQQMGGRKSYNPKNKGKKSYQPMLTFSRSQTIS
jgi:hypothetical protein